MSERRDGRVVARTEYLAPLEDELGRLDVALGVRSTATLATRAGERWFRYDPSIGESDWFDELPIASLDVTQFRADYETLCNTPPWSASFPPIAGNCDPIDIDDIEFALDDLLISSRLEEATVRWVRPRAIYANACGSLGNTPQCSHRQVHRGGRRAERGHPVHDRSGVRPQPGLRLPARRAEPELREPRMPGRLRV